MHHFSIQRYCIFTIEQQQSELISDLYLGARGKVCHSHAAETDVLRLAKVERLFEALVFNSESYTGSDVVTRKSATIRRWPVAVGVTHDELSSVSKIFVAAFLATFSFRRRRRRHARCSRLPNQAFPFIGFTE